MSSDAHSNHFCSDEEFVDYDSDGELGEAVIADIDPYAGIYTAELCYSSGEVLNM
jgi:hypothetical protein